MGCSSSGSLPLLAGHGATTMQSSVCPLSLWHSQAPSCHLLNCFMSFLPPPRKTHASQACSLSTTLLQWYEIYRVGTEICYKYYAFVATDLCGPFPPYLREVAVPLSNSRQYRQVIYFFCLLTLCPVFLFTDHCRTISEQGLSPKSTVGPQYGPEAV